MSGQAKATERSLRAELPLRQRGRAELELMQTLRVAMQPLFDHVKSTVLDSGTLDVPDENIVERRQRVDAVAASAELRAAGALTRWNQRVLTPRATDAYREAEKELADLAAPPAPASIEDVTAETGIPHYWHYEYHGTRGGWDASPVNGFVHHELVYRYILAPLFPGDIFAQRAEVATCAPRLSYDAVCDLGCGTGQFTMKLAERFPDAAITGVDLSLAELHYAQRRAADRDLDWDLRRAPVEDTRLPGESFDLVASYILLHELPPHATKKVFAEAFRLLRPGGDLVFSDVAPYTERDPYTAWWDDWLAEFTNEPWWRTAATLDLGAVASEAGFVDVTQTSLSDSGYPWVTVARKPERPD